MKTPVSFILIDDDYVNNLYCGIIIEEAAGELNIQTFENPEKGFDYISTDYLNSDNTTVLFLDINMPIWSGWDFLDNFEKLNENIKKQISIYILSSSLDPGDHKLAEDNKYVVGYIEKPLSELTVLSILAEHKASNSKLFTP